MLEMILDKHVIWVIIGLGAAAGVVSKCIVNVSLKRLVRGAGNMGKSTPSVYASGACEVRTCLHGQREGGKCRGICGQVSV